ncbi:MAG: enoyl-CoA hydratase-related protein [Solirubrobacterales bacterium]
MDYEQISYERRGPAAVITIERPERMNAIGAQAHRELVDAWARFREDETALVGILTGAGDRAFCAGGLEWACWCHLAIADEHASFGVTCRRWNIGLADGGTQRLPRIVGWRRAMELIVTGRVIDAAEALEIGLVNEVVPSGTCLDRALELAMTIAELPQPAIRTDLEAAERGWGRPLEEGLRIEAECFNRLLGEPEIIEGLRRFNERDHPDRDPAGSAATPGLRRDGSS